MLKKIIELKRMINGEFPLSLLIKRGLKVGKNFSKQSGCYIDPSHCFLITIGDNVTFSINVTLLAHDASMKNKLDYARIGSIVIGNNCFIGANSTILPGVEIGDNSIVGAGSVVTKSIEKNSVYAGVPAKKICTLETFLEKQKLKVFEDFGNFNQEENNEFKATYMEKQKKIGMKKIMQTEYLQTLIEIIVNSYASKYHETKIEKLIDITKDINLFWNLHTTFFLFPFSNIFQIYYNR